jgi:hypothetical protein
MYICSTYTEYLLFYLDFDAWLQDTNNFDFNGWLMNQLG